MSTFTYNIKAHPTTYNGVEFRSRLEATWAAYFDIMKWEWEYEPIDLKGWVPDFYVKFPCMHNECNGHHELYVEVKPFRSIEEFFETSAYRFLSNCKSYEACYPGYTFPAIAYFGLNPSISEWHMGHGAGGGSENLHNWRFVLETNWMHEKDGLIGNWIEKNPMYVWKQAQNLTRWRPR